MARGQDNSSFVFFVAFLTSLVVSVGSSLVMHLVVLPRIGVPGSRSVVRPVGLTPEATTQIPPLVGLSMEQARAVLSTSGLRMGLSGQRYDGRHPAGVVISQTPEQGMIAGRGSEIGVTISLGPSPSGATTGQPTVPMANAGAVAPRSPVVQPPNTGAVAVPSVKGVSLTRAKRLLEEKGLKVGKITYESDDDLAPNWILGQKPGAGTRLPAGSSVDLVVNKE